MKLKVPTNTREKQVKVDISRYVEQLRKYYAIQETIKKTKNYSEVARLFNLSRQRVWDIANRGRPPYPYGIGTFLHKKRCCVGKCKNGVAVKGKCPKHYAEENGIR